MSLFIPLARPLTFIWFIGAMPLLSYALNPTIFQVGEFSYMCYIFGLAPLWKKNTYLSLLSYGKKTIPFTCDYMSDTWSCVFYPFYILYWHIYKSHVMCEQYMMTRKSIIYVSKSWRKEKQTDMKRVRNRKLNI